MDFARILANTGVVLDNRLKYKIYTFNITRLRLDARNKLIWISALCMILILPVTLVPVNGQPDRKHQLYVKYILEVLEPAPPDNDYLYSVGISSLQNIADVAYGKMNSCYDHDQQGCTALKAKWLAAESALWNRKQDTTMTMMTYLNQQTTAYELCRGDGYTISDCSYIDTLQQNIRKFLSPEYDQDMWRYVSFVDGYGPTYEISYSTSESNSRPSTFWGKLLRTNCGDCDSADLAPSTPVVAFSPRITTISDLEIKLEELINDYRIENDLRPLIHDEALADIARLHSVEQATHRYLSHTNNSNENFPDRYENAGYLCETEVIENDGVWIYGGGENVLYNYLFEYHYEDGEVPSTAWMGTDELAEEMFEQWRTSPGHNENMLEPIWRRGGIGIAINQHAEILATNDFC